MIFVEVGSDPASAIIGNPDCRRTRVYPCKEKSRSQQKRRKFHIPIRSKLAPSNHNRSDRPTGVYPSNYGGKDVGPVLIRPSWEECRDRTCARGRQGRRQLSDEAGDRAVVRRLAWKFDLDVINVAPTPTLRRVVALDNRMTARFKVPTGVSMGRLIAATDMPALAAEPQVHPARSDPQAFLATQRARGDGPDLMGV